MKYQILIEILFLMLGREKVTAKYLAERFEVNLRTIYRYLRELELANIPIITERGADGGFYIADTYRFPAGFLTKAEYSKLSSVITAVSEQLGDKELDTIKNKLFLATKPTTDDPVLATNQLIIDGGDWSPSSTYKAKLGVITAAINECTVLQIKYHDRNGELSKRDIEPHALVLKNGLWYTYAYCRMRKEFRLFKVGRIEYAVNKETFVRRKFKTQLESFDKWEKTAKSFNFVFEVAPIAKSDVEEWLGIENVNVLSDGRIIANARLPYDKGLIFQIMKYGSNIKVIEPTKIAKSIVTEAKSIIKLYKGGNKNA